MSRPQIDYTNKDYASLLAALLELASEKLPEWTDKSPNDLGVMLLELFASMGDSLFYNQDRIAGESFLETAVERRSVVQLLRLIGYELKPHLAASADLTLLFQDDPTASVLITPLTEFKTTAAVTGTAVGFRYIQPALTIKVSGLPQALVDAKGTLTVLPSGAPPLSALPPGSAVYRVYQTLPVVQIDSAVTGEVLASSDGSPGQRYALSRAPIVDDTLVVRVNEGSGFAVWKRVSSLVESKGEDPHYVVRRDENAVVWIELGDGIYGKAPRRGQNNITADYGVGGGVKGNVPAGAISKIVTRLDPSLKLVLNTRAASGGAEAESTANAVLRGPQQFRTMGRAVTAADYETLARAFGVAKVLARSTTWNTIQLIVAPAGGGTPSDTLKEDLLAYLEPKRILTSLVTIVGPTYVPVHIQASVTVVPQFSRRLVQQQVEDTIGSLLGFDKLEFNRPLYISKLYEVIQDIEGVLFVNITLFARGPLVAGAPPLPIDGLLSFGERDKGELPIWQGFDGSTSKLTIQGGVLNG